MTYQVIEAHSDVELSSKLIVAINSGMLPYGDLAYNGGVWSLSLTSGVPTAPGAAAMVTSPTSTGLTSAVNAYLALDYSPVGELHLIGNQYYQLVAKGIPSPAGDFTGNIVATQIEDSTVVGRAVLTAPSASAAVASLNLGNLTVQPLDTLTYTGVTTTPTLNLLNVGGDKSFIMAGGSSPSISTNATSLLLSTSFNAVSLTVNSSGFSMAGGPVVVSGGVGIGVRPSANNTVSCGTAATGWTNVYAQSATITPSDERLKTEVGPIPDAVLDAWATVEFCKFRFKDGVRTHVGVIAQRVKEAFETAGINPFEYAVLCYDTWAATDEAPAGDRYSIRYEEALILECALMRRTINRG